MMVFALCDTDSAQAQGSDSTYTGIAGRYSQGATDPGGDPATVPFFTPNTLGEPTLPSDLDLSETPSSPATSSPIRVDIPTSRYFNYNGALTVLIGVSADAGCHLHLDDGTGAICQFDTTKPASYVAVLTDVAAKHLNKSRLWVAINGGTWPKGATTCTGAAPNPADQPFVYKDSSTAGECTNSNPCPNGVGHFYLDQKNAQFFANLNTVVSFANQNNIFVEVTFFAPWEGIWELGPWHTDHGRLTGKTTGVGFTDRSYFVKCDGACGNASSPNEALRAYQKNVIDWTIAELSNYDNVYFELANEPENWEPVADNPPKVSCGFTVPEAAEGSDIVSWQQMMITEFDNDESSQALKHVIGVQPFSAEGTAPYLKGGSVTGVSVINGHYTFASLARGGQGAIQLARADANQPRVLGFNEGKISGIGGGEGTCGWNGTAVDCSGEPDSARAEAWEFMLDGGATFDHFGYYYSSTYGSEIRQQMAALKNVFSALPLRQLITLADPPPTTSWVNIVPSPWITGGPNTTKYWASLWPSGTTYEYVISLLSKIGNLKIAYRSCFGSGPL
jgi:hypothetical protein